MSRRAAFSTLLILAVAALAGCGGSAKNSSPQPPATRSSTSGEPSPPPPAPPTTTAPGPGALQAEAASTATGDIPDNQFFLVFHDPAAGYSIKYPEGWAQSSTGPSVTFSDKNNIVRIVITRGAVSVASVDRQVSALKGAQIRQRPKPLTIDGSNAVKVVYTTESAANTVTGKRVALTVDRYYLGHAGKEAIVDLGTPVGVDNVDAYRLMIESFRWR